MWKRPALLNTAQKFVTYLYVSHNASALRSRLRYTAKHACIGLVEDKMQAHIGPAGLIPLLLSVTAALGVPRPLLVTPAVIIVDINMNFTYGKSRKNKN